MTWIFSTKISRSRNTNCGNQDYRYVICDDFEGDVKPAIRQAGVRISRHGGNNQERELTCSSALLSKLATLESVIARDPDNPLNQ